MLIPVANAIMMIAFGSFIVAPNHDKYGVSVYDETQFQELRRIVDGSVILTADEYTMADREVLDINKIGKHAEAVKAMSRSKDKV